MREKGGCAFGACQPAAELGFGFQMAGFSGGLLNPSLLSEGINSF